MALRIQAGIAVLAAAGSAVGIGTYHRNGTKAHTFSIGAHILMSDPSDGSAVLIFRQFPSLAATVQMYARPGSLLQCRVVQAENNGYCSLKLTRAFAGNYLSRALDAETVLTDDSKVTVQLDADAALYTVEDVTGQSLVEHARTWLDPRLGLSAVKVSCEEPNHCYLTLSNEPLPPTIASTATEASGCSARIVISLIGLGDVASRVSMCPGEEDSGLSSYAAVLRVEMAAAFHLPSFEGETVDTATLRRRAAWVAPKGITRVVMADPPLDSVSVMIVATHELGTGSGAPIVFQKRWSLPLRRCTPVDELSNHELMLCHPPDSTDIVSSEISCRTGLERRCGGRLALLITDPAMSGRLIGALQDRQHIVKDGMLQLSDIKMSDSDPSAFVAAYQRGNQSLMFVECEAADAGRANCRVRSQSCNQGELSGDEVSSRLALNAAETKGVSRCFHVSLLAQH